MSSSNLIRVGGLAAMVGSALYALQSLLWPSYRENVFFYFLLLGGLAAIAAIAALAVLEGERWKLAWTLVASLVAFVGITLMLVYELFRLAEQEPQKISVVVTVLFVGLFVGTLGLLALGILVMVLGVLPWWGGAALIAGSPLSAFFLRLLELSLPGVVWVVVGYAIFRAAGRRTKGPPRVQ